MLWNSQLYCLWWNKWHPQQKCYMVVRKRPSFPNETGPLPLCTFSVMGLSMCSSIFSESSPVRSKSGIINELSGSPNSVPKVRCSYASSSWHGHTGHAYCVLLCRKTLVLSAEFGTKIKFHLSTFIQKLLVFIKNYSTIHRSDNWKQFFIPQNFDIGRILPKQNSIHLLKMV